MFPNSNDNCLLGGVLAFDLNFGSTRNMLHQIYDNAILTFESDLLKIRLMNAFDGISADEYAKKLEETQWHLGDIVEDGNGHKAMIIQDDHYFYELMKIKDEDAFQTFRYFAISDNLTVLQDNHPEWHKVGEE